MPKLLTQDQIDRYRRDGVVFPLRAFPADDALAHRRRLEDFEAGLGHKIRKPHVSKPHLLLTWVDRIVRHPAVLDAVEDLIGPDIMVFHHTVWPKDAQDGTFVGWHQDATYFGLEPADGHVTAW